MATDPRLDIRAHVTAIKAALNVAAGSTIAFEWGQVPGEVGTGVTKPLPIWTLVSVRRRLGESLSLSAEAGMTLWEATVGAVGSSPKEVQWALFEVGSDALNEKTLTIAGSDTSPLQFQPGAAINRQGQQYFASDVYTYAL